MPSLGILEILMIGIMLLLFVGPENLPHTVRWMGRTYGQLRRAADELRRAMVIEADRMDEEERLRDLRERRVEAAAQRKAAEEGAGDGTMAQPDPLMAAQEQTDAEALEQPPEGFDEAEWAEMPAHVREIIRRRRRESP